MARKRWHAWKESNPQPLVLETSALPVELHTQKRKMNRRSRGSASPFRLCLHATTAHGSCACTSLHWVINPSTSRRAAHAAGSGGEKQRHTRNGERVGVLHTPASLLSMGRPVVSLVEQTACSELLKNLGPGGSMPAGAAAGAAGKEGELRKTAGNEKGPEPPGCRAS